MDSAPPEIHERAKKESGIDREEGEGEGEVVILRLQRLPAGLGGLWLEHCLGQPLLGVSQAQG